jgi:hypothetical protein
MSPHDIGLAGLNRLRYNAELLRAPYVDELLPATEAAQYGASVRFEIVRRNLNRRPRPSELDD